MGTENREEQRRNSRLTRQLFVGGSPFGITQLDIYVPASDQIEPGTLDGAYRNPGSVEQEQQVPTEEITPSTEEPTTFEG